MALQQSANAIQRLCFFQEPPAWGVAGGLYLGCVNLTRLSKWAVSAISGQSKEIVCIKGLPFW